MPRKRSKERSAIRLGGGGEYSPQFAILEEARDLFFDAVRRRCPDAFRDLRDKVLPVYQAWLRSGDPATVASVVARNLLLLEQSAPEVAQAVSEWCARWRLAGVEEPLPEEPMRQTSEDQNEESKQAAMNSWVSYGEDWEPVARARALWPGHWAVATLHCWSDPESGGKMLAVDPPAVPRTIFGFSNAPKVEINLQIRGWSGTEDIEAFRQRVHAAADEWIHTYLERRRNELDRELERAPGKHGREHFDWLALYQVCGRLEFQILPEFPHISDPSTISKGIHAAAALIGLVVRNA